MTRAIYLKLWKKCNSWCASKGFQVKNIISVLEFLHDGMEKELTAGTLKTQVTALSSFFEKTLSKEPLISRFFRAFSALKFFPVGIYLFFLQGFMEVPFEPLQEAFLKNLVLKTIFLVAITSSQSFLPFTRDSTTHLLFGSSQSMRGSL